MFLKRLATGMLMSNCYILGDSGDGAVIDPGADIGEIAEVLGREGLALKYIILTHAHIDHIISMEALRKRYGAPVLVHEADGASLGNPLCNGAGLFGLDTVFNNADRLLKDGDMLDLGSLRLEIIYTPGHTAGSISIRAGSSVFTGDTLFRMGVGRTDLGGGDERLLMDSLKNKLMRLEDEIIVYPGHGTSSTIGYERISNPYF